MNFKQEVIDLLSKFPLIKPREMIKLNRYFIEYTRELAEKCWLDTIKEYKRTSKLIKIYNDKGYDCLGTVRTILDIYDQIAKTQTHYEDSETMISNIVTTNEMEEMKCLVGLLQESN
jgi:hypothetical protein